MTINNYNNSEDYDNFDTSLNDGLTFSSLHHFFYKSRSGRHPPKLNPPNWFFSIRALQLDWMD